MTRQQRFMGRAMEHIRKVERESGKVPKIYGGMCHKLPVLIRTCGLCQAVAFVESKAGENKKDREKAHSLLRDHIKETLVAEGLSEDIWRMDLYKYALATRTLLRAWLYYKRFAASILKVETAQDAEDADG